MDGMHSRLTKCILVTNDEGVSNARGYACRLHARNLYLTV